MYISIKKQCSTVWTTLKLVALVKSLTLFYYGSYRIYLYNTYISHENIRSEDNNETQFL